MNIIILNPTDLERGIQRHDSRFKHLQKILKVKPGEIIKTGLLNGPLGESEILTVSDEFIKIDFKETAPSPPPFPVTCVLGLVRPPTAQRLLKDLTAMGVERLVFTRTDLTEKSYAMSNLWQKERYHSYLMEGLQQGGTTQLPELDFNISLNRALEEAKERGPRLFLDVLTPPEKKGASWDGKERPVTVFIGPERGWSDRERAVFYESGTQCFQLYERILRTETCSAAAVILILQKMGLIHF